MRLSPRFLFAPMATLLLAAGSAFASAAGTACDGELARQIPARPPEALTGGEFAERARDLAGPPRDAMVQGELEAGDVPAFLRHLVPVTVSDAQNSVTVCVMPDYLALGTDQDFAYVPLGLEAALDVADRLGFMLPTRKLVNAIYAESTVKLDPQPLPAGDAMRSTDYLVRHNAMVRAQRQSRGAALGDLTAGDKKDLVLTPRLWEVPGRVAIYGWHRAVGSPIQPLSTVHGARYADYSHGIRLVSQVAYVNGVERPLVDVLADPRLASLVSDEGPMPRLTERLSALRAGLRSDMAAAPTVAWLPRQGSSARAAP